MMNEGRHAKPLVVNHTSEEACPSQVTPAVEMGRQKLACHNQTYPIQLSLKVYPQFGGCQEKNGLVVGRPLDLPRSFHIEAYSH